MSWDTPPQPRLRFRSSLPLTTKVELGHGQQVASVPAEISPPPTLDLAGASRRYVECKPWCRTFMLGVNDFGELIQHLVAVARIALGSLRRVWSNLRLAAAKNRTFASSGAVGRPGFGWIVGRRVRPAAIATALFWVGLGVFAAFYFSSTIVDDSKTYGPIGVTFTLVTWFIAIGAVLTLGAVVGAIWQRRRTGTTKARAVPGEP
jgi:hypothetical protein